MATDPDKVAELYRFREAEVRAQERADQRAKETSDKKQQADSARQLEQGKQAVRDDLYPVIEGDEGKQIKKFLGRAHMGIILGKYGSDPYLGGSGTHYYVLTGKGIQAFKMNTSKGDQVDSVREVPLRELVDHVFSWTSPNHDAPTPLVHRFKNSPVFEGIGKLDVPVTAEYVREQYQLLLDNPPRLDRRERP